MGQLLPVMDFSCIRFTRSILSPGTSERSTQIIHLAFRPVLALSICPGLVFREHYYITLMPAVAILFAVFIDYGLELSKQFSRLKLIKHLSFILLIIAAAAGIIKQYDYLFVQSPEDICRSVYGSNPFPESIAIAKYIEVNSKKDDKIAILGSEPELYFYANRHSASGYIYTYSLMDNQPDSLKMQQEMISEIESSMPEYVIYFNIPSSWMMRPNSDKYIFSWIGPFLDKNKYEIKAIGDVLPDETVMKWDSEALNYNLQSKYFILVLRKPHSPLTGN